MIRLAFEFAQLIDVMLQKIEEKRKKFKNTNICAATHFSRFFFLTFLFFLFMSF